MFLEYINYSPDFYDNDLTKLAEEFPEYLSTAIVPPYYIRAAKNKLPNNIAVSCLIDYPLGLSNASARLDACQYAIKNKTDKIDIVMQSSNLANRKYDKIREELKNVTDLMKDSNIETRYILEYRSFDHQCLKKACEILCAADIDTIALSTGYGVDVLSDFIIASKFLLSNKKSMKIILTANFWTENHIETMLKHNFYAVRSSHMHSLKYLSKFANTKKN